MNIVALKDIKNADPDGKLYVAVPWGTEGTIVDRYVWGPHQYVVAEFTNGVRMEFGDASHPLISYKGKIRIYERLCGDNG